MQESKSAKDATGSGLKQAQQQLSKVEHLFKKYATKNRNALFSHALELLDSLQKLTTANPEALPDACNSKTSLHNAYLLHMLGRIMEAEFLSVIDLYRDALLLLVYLVTWIVPTSDATYRTLLESSQAHSKHYA